MNSPLRSLLLIAACLAIAPSQASDPPIAGLADLERIEYERFPAGDWHYLGTQRRVHFIQHEEDGLPLIEHRIPEALLPIKSPKTLRQEVDDSQRFTISVRAHGLVFERHGQKTRVLPYEPTLDWEQKRLETFLPGYAKYRNTTREVLELWDGFVLHADTIEDGKAMGAVLVENPHWSPPAATDGDLPGVQSIFPQFIYANEATYSVEEKRLALEGRSLTLQWGPELITASEPRTLLLIQRDQFQIQRRFRFLPWYPGTNHWADSSAPFEEWVPDSVDREMASMENVELWDGMILYAEVLEPEKASGLVYIKNSFWHPDEDQRTNTNYSFDYAIAKAARYSLKSQSLELLSWPTLYMENGNSLSAASDGAVIHIQKGKFQVKGPHQIIMQSN